jgi:hypothetical protein
MDAQARQIPWYQTDPIGQQWAYLAGASHPQRHTFLFLPHVLLVGIVGTHETKQHEGYRRRRMGKNHVKMMSEFKHENSKRMHKKLGGN